MSALSDFRLLFTHNFREPFFLAEIFEMVSFHPYDFRITRRSAWKSEQMKNF